MSWSGGMRSTLPCGEQLYSQPASAIPGRRGRDAPAAGPAPRLRSIGKTARASLGKCKGRALRGPGKSSSDRLCEKGAVPVENRNTASEKVSEVAQRNIEAITQLEQGMLRQRTPLDRVSDTITAFVG